ncbi:MAG: GlmU family protein [Chitinophagales bacterium]|nr:GlmU family protein [Chitinophagales bacterium]MDW8418135.1 GlmU family protein [Chitinophagales bacterium]
MNFVLFDPLPIRQRLLPFTYTRTVADIRLGILTIREKWERCLQAKAHSLTEHYLTSKYAACPDAEGTLYINGSILPDEKLLDAIRGLGAMQALMSHNMLIAFKSEKQHLNYENYEGIARGFTHIPYAHPVIQLKNIYDIFSMNHTALKDDFRLITSGRTSQKISSTNTVIGSETEIFLEEGAVVEASILNTKNGPIYIGHHAEVMEGCAIRGGFALCEHGTLKMSAKVYGATTLGPHCKAGGELNNVVMFGYSNKAHDGFLGNSVIGEWCNLGADTNNSNLKNNYGIVEIFSYAENKSVSTGLQFCGLFMGDHSKSGINTMFNTGTVVGVSANIFGGDFPPKFIPSFSWGGAQWLRTFTFDKAIEVATRVMERRGIVLSDADKAILREVYQRDAVYREKF